MTRTLGWLLGGVLVTVAVGITLSNGRSTVALASNPPVARLQPATRDLVTVGGQSAVFYRSVTLSEGHPEITRAVIAIHGLGVGSATPAAAAALATAAEAGEAANTVVLAPQFDPTSPVEGTLCWPGAAFDGFPAGSLGCVTQGGRLAGTWVTSYDVVDALVTRLADRRIFPNLRKITVAGHSAGGQFVQRYAGVSTVADPAALAGRSLRFVVSNPSSYMYLSPLRYVAGRGFVGGDPAMAACQGYDTFRYGLLHAAVGTYGRELDPSAIRDRYLSRDVVYLLGEADTERDGSLSVTCAADLQGATRFERGKRFWQYLQTYYPGHHRILTVPGVGHSARGMYLSANGKAALIF